MNDIPQNIKELKEIYKGLEARAWAVWQEYHEIAGVIDIDTDEFKAVFPVGSSQMQQEAWDKAVAAQNMADAAWAQYVEAYDFWL